MGRTLKPPRVSKLAEIEAKRMARLDDPNKVAGLAAKAAKRLDRANRFAAQIQRQAELKSRREAQARAKALKDERRDAKSALAAQAEARRKARLEKRAEVESRRSARLQRRQAKEAKWVERAQKEEKAYQWRQRKAEIADYKANRGAYLTERKRLAKENPWALVLEQEDLVELAYRRKLLLRQDERGAKSVMGADDPDTILDWHRLKKEWQSASNSWQHEKRKLHKLTQAARAFDEAAAAAASFVDVDQT